MRILKFITTIIISFSLISCSSNPNIDDKIRVIYYDGMTTICATLLYSENDCVSTIDQAVIDKHYEKFNDSLLNVDKNESDYFYEGMLTFLKIKNYSDNDAKNIVDEAKINKYYEQYKTNTSH